MGVSLAAFTAWIATTLEVSIATATLITNILVSTALSLTLSFIGSLLQPSFSPARQKETVRQAVAPRRRYYGRVKAGGIYAFLHDRAGWLYQLLIIASGEIDAFEQHWLGNDKLTLVRGKVTVPERYKNNGSQVYIETRTGTDSSTAYSRLVAAFTDLWSSNHKLLGIATTLVSIFPPRAKDFTKSFPAGVEPYTTVFRGAKVWDPRKADQDPDDPSTWTWTQNGVLIVMDYLWHADGMRLPRSMITNAIDVWKAQANIADQTVSLKDGGTEKRWRLSGGYELTMPPKQVLPLMLNPMDAVLTLHRDGTIWIRVGQYVTPDVTLTDSHIVSYSGLMRGREKADVRNEIRANFVSPDYNYIEQEADPWRDEDSIDIDGLQSMTMDLTWAPSHSQARRRMKIEAYRQNPDWSGQIVTNAYGLNALGRRFIHVTIGELDIDDSFELQAWAYDAVTSQCTLTISHLPSAAYDWTPADDEGTAPPLPDAANADSVETPSGLSVDVASTVGAMTLSASVTAPTQDNLTLELSYRVHDDGISDDDADWHDFVLTSDWAGSTTQLAIDTYDVRAIFHAPKGLVSDPAYVRSVVSSSATAINLSLRFQGGTAGRKPDAGEVLFDTSMKAGDVLEAGLPGSLLDCSSTDPPAADWTMTLKKNGVSIGTGTIPAGMSTGTYTFAADVTFADGDSFSDVAPTPQDTTAKGVRYTIIGKRTA
jgi:hypothetical protein